YLANLHPMLPQRLQVSDQGRTLSKRAGERRAELPSNALHTYLPDAGAQEGATWRPLARIYGRSAGHWHTRCTRAAYRSEMLYKLPSGSLIVLTPVIARVQLLGGRGDRFGNRPAHRRASTAPVAPVPGHRLIVELVSGSQQLAGYLDLVDDALSLL